MEKRISVVIPSYNKSDTIGKCLDAVFSSEYKHFEVVVVDDCSDDNSLDIIRQYPCELICLEERSGTSVARNRGAEGSTGEVIFFTDADCLLQKDTLSLVNIAISRAGHDTVIGGTYTKLPYDVNFFSIFQSLFVHYSETKNTGNPDYIAAHAMIMSAGMFKKSGGFPEDFLPIIEDVEFSHRLKRSGCRLIMDPDIQVQHIFGFSFIKSLKNAFRKTKYWCIYALKNRGLLTDSGSASTELKTNVASFLMILLLILLWAVTHSPLPLYFLPVVVSVNIFVSRNLVKMFFKSQSIRFAGLASLYYIIAYPLPVGLGTISAVYHILLRK
jgi:glycosyltransferase involved in cell wall biosynthesis